MKDEAKEQKLFGCLNLYLNSMSKSKGTLVFFTLLFQIRSALNILCLTTLLLRSDKNIRNKRYLKRSRYEQETDTLSSISRVHIYYIIKDSCFIRMHDYFYIPL